MAWVYSAENHDWDLTMHAAWELLTLGQALDQKPTTGNLPGGFSAYTGSMLLSFSAIESFSTSIAFSMPDGPKFSNFDFEKYRKTPRFWCKIEIIFKELSQPVDKSQGLFQVIKEMQDWRNLVTHASPYRIDETPIKNTTSDASCVHKVYKRKQYPSMVNVTIAKRFYDAAYNYIALIKELSGLNPRAIVRYTPGAPTDTLEE